MVFGDGEGERRKVSRRRRRRHRHVGVARAALPDQPAGIVRIRPYL